MPYRYERLKIKLPRDLDRRIKLSEEDKQAIVQLYKTTGISTRSLAAQYGVSRRSIQFILDPDKLVRNLEMRDARGGSMIYYDKDKHNESMKEHRKYKHKVLKELNK